MKEDSMKFVDGRFVIRDENWGSLIQDVKNDRLWAIDNKNMEQRLSEFKELLYMDNPYQYNKSFFYGDVEEKKLTIEAPISLSWEITNRCNSKCVFCCNDSGIGENELTFKEIKEIVNTLLEWNCMRIIIGGGEPLVREDILDVLKLFENTNNKPAIATNGILLNNKIIEQITKSCITLQISLDSLKRDTYAKLRGIDVLDKVKENIIEAKKRFDNVRIVTVINKYNYDELENIAEFVSENNIKQWFVFNLLPSGRGAKNYNELKLNQNINIKEKLKKIKEQNQNMAIWYWGENSNDGIAIYILPDGTLSFVDYLKDIHIKLSNEKVNVGVLKEEWKKIDNKSKIATLKNFTSKNELY